MNLNNLYMREVPYRHWNNLRLSNGVRSQNRYIWPEERIGYGLIIDPLEYRDFIDLFEDLSTEDDWLEGFGIEANGKRKNYYNSHLHSIIDGRLSENRKALLEFLEQADKVSIGIKSDEGEKIIDHIHFRKNCSSVYSGSIRIKPCQLDNFQTWGFKDPRIFYVKSDFFPIQDARRKNEN